MSGEDSTSDTSPPKEDIVGTVEPGPREGPSSRMSTRLYAPTFVFLGLVVFGGWMLVRTNNPIWIALSLPLGVAWLIFAVVREVRMHGTQPPRPDPPGKQNLVE